jgi:hypothetical protein
VLFTRWEQLGVDVGCAVPAIVGCLAAAVVGFLCFSMVLGAIAGIVVVVGSIVAIINLGASADVGPWFRVFGSGAAIMCSGVATFRYFPTHVKRDGTFADGWELRGEADDASAGTREARAQDRRCCRRGLPGWGWYRRRRRRVRRLRWHLHAGRGGAATARGRQPQ